MTYIALLRGINVGGNRKVAMSPLKNFFELLGYTHVSTYLNSGNVIFDAFKHPNPVIICDQFHHNFGFPVQILVKSAPQMHTIAQSIPAEWTNDNEQKTDVAYLFSDTDIQEIISQLPINKEFVDIHSTPGAIIFHVTRANYAKSHLNKLITHKLYQSMTLRNANTARFLGNIKSN